MTREALLDLLEWVRLALMGPIPENLDHPLLDKIEELQRKLRRGESLP